MQYLERAEEKKIKLILTELASSYGFKTKPQEKYNKEQSRYLDMLWWINMRNKEIPVVAFEIEKGTTGYNERLRKNIFNLALSRAPQGYIILPYERILRNGKSKWFRKKEEERSSFKKAFENYYRPFSGFINIDLVDADEVLTCKRLNSIKIS